MAAAPDETPGWTRLVLRTRPGVDRDCAVLDANKEQVLYIASSFFLPSIGEVRAQDRDGAPLYVLRGRLLAIHRHIAIRAPDGSTVARVRAAWRSPWKGPIRVRLSDGTQWETDGSLAKRQYVLADAGKPIVNVDQKWVQIRDSCKVDVADGIDPALAAAVVWAIDDLLDDRDPVS